MKGIFKMSAPVSVITIVKNRTDKLCNLITQLEACCPTPDELLIVWMTPPSDLSLITNDKFNIEHKFVNQDELPIAKARNKGMFDAKNDVLVYVGVDSIFSSSCFQEGLSALAPSSIVTAPIQSIPITSHNYPYHQLINAKSDTSVNDAISVTQANDTLHFDALHDAQRHNDLSINTFLPNSGLPKNVWQKNTELLDKQLLNKKDDNHGKFSHHSTASAMFFIRKADFEKTGGFDETYDGYGLNDEDFFTQCSKIGLSLIEHPSIVFSPARDLNRCPVNHLLDFAHNAQLFYEKWGFYPRKDILCAYADKGLINKDFEHRGIRVTRLPNEEEMMESEKALEPVDKSKQFDSNEKKFLQQVLEERKAPTATTNDSVKSNPSDLRFFQSTGRKSA